MRRTTALIAAAVLGLSLLTPTAANAADRSAGDVVPGDRTGDVTTVLDGLNDARLDHGLSPLRYAPALAQVAQDWSVELAESDRFVHQPSSASKYPRGYTRVGEIIARNTTGSASRLVETWMGSTSHRNLILGDFTHVGPGVTQATGYAPYPRSTTTLGVANLAKYPAATAPSSYTTVESWRIAQGARLDDVVARVDSVEVVGDGTVIARGWAYDPSDVRATVNVSMWVSGQQAVRTAANESSASLQSDGIVGSHGFTLRLPAPRSGTAQICGLASNTVGPGDHERFTCTTRALGGDDVVAAIDSVTASDDGTVIVRGTAYDESDTSATVRVSHWLSGGSAAVRASANLASPALVARGIPGSHGYEVRLRGLPGATTTVCGLAANAVGAGEHHRFACQTVNIGGDDVVAQIESITTAADGTIRVRGYAYDATRPRAIVNVAAWINGQGVTRVRADLASAGVWRQGIGGSHGFEIELSALPGSSPRICGIASNTVGAGDHFRFACQDAAAPSSHDVVGQVESVTVSAGRTLVVRGWTYDASDSRAQGNVSFWVSSGQGSTRARADGPTPHLQQQGIAGAHGFEVRLSAPRGSVRVCGLASNTVGAGDHLRFPCRWVEVP